MMKRVTSRICGGLLCLMAHATMATPPDILDVHDELFGIAKESILVLRSTRDNLGTYYTDQQDVLLVEIDRETGAETLYPVYRMRSEAGTAPDDSDLSRTRNGTLAPESVNPYRKLYELNGEPFWRPDFQKEESVSIKVTADLVRVEFDDGVVAEAERAALLGRHASALDDLAKALGEYSRIAPVTPHDLLDDAVSDPESCQFADAFRHDDLSGAQPVQLLRVTCDAYGQVTSLLVPIP